MYELAPGTILIGQNRYVVERVLGQGGFGFTYLVSAQIMNQNIPVTTQFAVKEFFLKSHCMRDDNGQMTYSQVARDEVLRCQKDFKNEAQRLVSICQTNRKSGREAQINNHHIVPVNECFDANGTSYFVMEYLSGGSLRQRVKQNGPMSEVQALSFIKPIVDAVEFLHQRQILHMDIKPENIVMRSGGNAQADVPMLIDFGISLHFDNKGSRTTLSNSNGLTPGYSPMEQAQPITTFDPRVDVYAIGATTYYLLTGKDPANAADITPEIIEQSLPASVSRRTRNAIVHAMQPLKQQRTASATDFLKELAASYTLPVGYILHGPLSDYRITRILDDRGSHIVYEARRLTNDNELVSAQQSPLCVMEQFVKGVSTRNPDASVTLGNITPAHTQDFAQAVTDATGLNALLPEPDMAQGKNDLVEAICFQNANTRYCVYYTSFKPQSVLAKSLNTMAEGASQVAEEVTGKLRRNQKIILSVIAGAVIVALGLIYVPRLVKSIPSTPANDSTTTTVDSVPTSQQEDSEVNPEQDNEQPSEQNVEEQTQDIPATSEKEKKDLSKPDKATQEKAPTNAEKVTSKETAVGATNDQKTAEKPQKANEKPAPNNQGQADQQALALMQRIKASGQPSAADMNKLNSLKSKTSPQVKAQIEALNAKWDW